MVLERFQYLHRPRCLSRGYHRQHARARGWCVVAARGNFPADLARIKLDRVLLRHARETLPRTVYAVNDPRMFVIAFLTAPRQQIYASGVELVPDTIVVFRAASEGHNRYV